MDCCMDCISNCGVLATIWQCLWQLGCGFRPGRVVPLPTHCYADCVSSRQDQSKQRMPHVLALHRARAACRRRGVGVVHIDFDRQAALTAAHAAAGGIWQCRGVGVLRSSRPLFWPGSLQCSSGSSSSRRALGVPVRGPGAMHGCHGGFAVLVGSLQFWYVGARWRQAAGLVEQCSPLEFVRRRSLLLVCCTCNGQPHLDLGLCRCLSSYCPAIARIAAVLGSTRLCN